MVVYRHSNCTGRLLVTKEDKMNDLEELMPYPEPDERDIAVAHCGRCECCFPEPVLECACVALNALAQVQGVETVEEAQVIYSPSNPKPLVG